MRLFDQNDIDEMIADPGLLAMFQEIVDLVKERGEPIIQIGREVSMETLMRGMGCDYV